MKLAKVSTSHIQAVYGTFGLLAAFLVLRYVPETKGLDQESMSAFWRRQAGLSATPAS